MNRLKLGDRMCGAPRELTEDDLEMLLPTWDEEQELGGIPYLLYSDSSLHDQGWPTMRDLPNGVFRQAALLNQLGIDALGDQGDANVFLCFDKV